MDSLTDREHRNSWEDNQAHFPGLIVCSFLMTYRAPRTMPVSTRDWLSVEMMAVFERDFPPGWLPFVHSTPLS
jgi:hypothetical protein